MTDSKKRLLLKILLPLLALAVGAAIMAFLVKTKPEAKKGERKHEGTLVEVMEVSSGRHDVSVTAQGTVIPAQRVTLQPQVGGEVVWQNEQLVPGGKLEAGERLLRIDPSDYRLAVESNRAQVARAQLELEVEESRRQIAEREWELFAEDEQTPSPEPEVEETPDAGTTGRDLALRRPQLETAEVGVESARSALKKSRLDLRRTTIDAPFNAMILEENVDPGQVVGPGAPIATIVGTDHFWVQVSIPVEALGTIDIPGVAGATEGAAVRVWQTSGGKRVEREGRVTRLLADLGRGGSMARVLVEIHDPLGLDPETGAELPMLLNSYVTVEIDADPIDDAIEVPRVALRDGDAVYVVGEGERLEKRSVHVAWRREKSVLVTEGLEPGDRVITSPIATPVEGMKLRIEDGSSAGKAVAEARDVADGDTTDEARP